MRVGLNTDYWSAAPPVAKITDEVQEWKETCITTALITGPPATLEQVAGVLA